MSSENKAPKPITGKVVVTEDHKDLLTAYVDFEPLPGEYHMIKLDKQGKEILGSDFSIKPREYNRTYSKLPKQFSVKKSPQ